jgi:cell division protein FtsZ
VCMKGASALLVSITGGNDLTLYEVDEAASRIRAEADPDANIIVGATFDDELDGSIRVSVVATGIGLAPQVQHHAPPMPLQAAVAQDRGRLSERLAGLTAMPPHSPMDADEASLVLGANEMVKEPQVWRAPGNVTIEKRPLQMQGAPLPLGAAKPQPAAPQMTFQPAPPAMIRRPVRRMPAVEELPLVAQNEIKAQAGQAPQLGLAAQKRRVGFLERLAGVGRARKEPEPEMRPVKREPEFGQQWQSPEMPRMQPQPQMQPQTQPDPDPQPQAQAAPRGVRIERPRQAAPVALAPKRVEPQPRLAQLETAGAPAESPGDDDLEIPAFLRRRVN